MVLANACNISSEENSMYNIVRNSIFKNVFVILSYDMCNSG